MDEPFGAIDPITRERLQGEFLRLQREVRKTIVFVTHDIEEAVRIGDRIAVLSMGAHIEQYDTPAQILGNPASPFVADFVGADRGLKRLTVTAIDQADLETPPVVHEDDTVEDARRLMEHDGAKWAIVVDATTPSGDGSASTAPRAREWSGTEATAWTPGCRWAPASSMAFSEMLQHDAGWVAVLDGERFVGVLTPESLHAALRRSIDEAEGVPLTASPIRD